MRNLITFRGVLPFSFICFLTDPDNKLRRNHVVTVGNLSSSYRFTFMTTVEFVSSCQNGLVTFQRHHMKANKRFALVYGICDDKKKPDNLSLN